MMIRGFHDIKAAGLAMAIAGLALTGRMLAHKDELVAAPPAIDTAITSTRQITSIAVAMDGEVWAGTMGGVLRRTREGVWKKYTRRDGLPSHEVRRVSVWDRAVVADFPMARAIWNGSGWRIEGQTIPVDGSRDRPTCTAAWLGGICTASVSGLTLKTAGGSTEIPLPNSPGTHVTALLPKPDVLWTAMYGDGIWEYRSASPGSKRDIGGGWKRLEIGLPASAREITAIAEGAGSVWLGTRREGIWQFDGRDWKQYIERDEPFDHNVQSMATYRGVLYVSTLEDGMSIRTTAGWRHIGLGTLSSDAPRQMVEYQGRLYVRHGNGMVDRTDGERWEKNIFASLPRKQASTLSVDRERIYVGQWGGWSEYDGQLWTHHLNVPELQGLPITAVLPARDSIWIGTQNKGVAEWDRKNGRLTWHDERRGLPDDWVTCLSQMGDKLCAGTFVGGLAWCDGRSWNEIAALKGENVTGLEPDGTGGLFVATRTGVWALRADMSIKRLNDAHPFLDTEVQSIQALDRGLWVGTRTGLYFLAHPSSK